MVNQPVADADVQDLVHDGAIVLRNVLSARWIERLARAIDEELGHASPTGAEFGGTEGRFYGDLFLWLRNPEFAAVALDSPLPEIAGRLMGSSRVNLFYDQLFVKEPGAIEPTPWHQDLPYWPIDGAQVVSIWIPVDTATPDNGVVSYVRGSHLWGRKFRPQAFGKSGNSSAYNDSPFEPIPDIEGHRDSYQFLSWCLEPGDVLVHHGMTIHGAPGNRTAAARRRALAVRYTGDDVRYAPRPGTFMEIKAVQEFVPPPDIPAGGAMGGRLFPQAWPSQRA